MKLLDKFGSPIPEKNVVSDNPVSSGNVIRRMRIANFAIKRPIAMSQLKFSDFDEIW